MNAAYTTKSGKIVALEVLRTRNGTTGLTMWEMISAVRLDQDEVEEVIESQFPSAGYGASTFTRFPQRTDGSFPVRVSSFSSCD